MFRPPLVCMIFPKMGNINVVLDEEREADVTPHDGIGDHVTDGPSTDA